jgi:hypothetical protein
LPVPWSSPRVFWILVKDRSQLNEQEKVALEQMVAFNKQVEVTAQLAERFVKVVKQKEPNTTWTKR